MTERSWWWTDGKTDGGLYSESSMWLLMKLLLGNDALDADKGVILGYRNACAPSSPGADQVTIGTGGALVDGTPYDNDAAVTLTATRPTVGTTGKRLVLRKTFAAGTVRATVIASADGTATLPALTQDATYWDIPIASFTHATAGTIGALTDEREYIAIGGGGMGEANRIHPGGQFMARSGLAKSFTGVAVVANQAIYWPFTVSEPVTVKRAGCEFTSPPSWNVDMGIYDDDGDGKPGDLLTSTGAVAAATETDAAMSDVTLVPGQTYYAAISCSGTASMRMLTPTTSVHAMNVLGFYVEAGAHPLPSTATPVKASSGNLGVPMVTFSRTA